MLALLVLPLNVIRRPVVLHKIISMAMHIVSAAEGTGTAADGTVASCRAAVRGGPPRLGRAVVRGGPPRRGRSAARGGPARLHVEGRRVVPGQPYVEGRHGRTWTAGASLPSELWQDGTGTATGGTDA